MSNPWNRMLKTLFPNRPNSPRDWILPRRKSTPPIRLNSGLYHFQQTRDGEYLRFHLRVDPDGSGLLLAAAAEAIRLSPAAAVVAELLLQDRTPQQAIESLTKDYHLEQAEAKTIVGRVNEALSELGRPDSRFPVFNLVDPAAATDNIQLMAPFQADVVIDLFAAGDDRQYLRLLDRLWEAAIPHVRFLGDQTNANDQQESPAGVQPHTLVSSVTHAEDIGMISGLRATAATLLQDGLLERLAGVGLDYVVLPWAITPAGHTAVYGAEDFQQLTSAIQTVQRLEMTPVLQVPLVDPFAEELEEQIEQLRQWNISHLEVFAIVEADGDKGVAASGEEQPLRALQGRELRQLAAWIEGLAAENPLQISWLPPVAIEQDEQAAVIDAIRKGPRAGGDISIRVEANGDVTAPRGPADVAGNLLEQSWEAVWGNAAFDRLRGLVEREAHCDQCPGLAICAAACPAEPAGWALPPTNDEKAGDASSKGGSRD